MSTGRVESVSVARTGTSKDGREWTILKVKIDGQDYSTFDTAWKDFEGQVVDFEFETKETESGGKVYHNRNLKGKPKPSNPIPADPFNTKSVRAIREYAEEHRKLLSRLIEELEGVPF